MTPRLAAGGAVMASKAARRRSATDGAATNGAAMDGLIGRAAPASVRAARRSVRAMPARDGVPCECGGEPCQHATAARTATFMLMGRKYRLRVWSSDEWADEPHQPIDPMVMQDGAGFFTIAQVPLIPEDEPRRR